MKKDSLQHRLLIALSANEKKPADLCRALDIPKSALSQYMSGKSRNMSAERLQDIATYLNVSEAWLMGYDVPMKRVLTDADEYYYDADVTLLSDNEQDRILECQLLDDFRKLNKAGKEQALIQIYNLAQLPSYTKGVSSDQIGTA